MTIQDTIGTLIEEIAQGFVPLSMAQVSPESYLDYLAELGWDFDVLPAALDNLVAPVAEVRRLLDGEADTSTLLNAELNAFGAIDSLKSAPGLSDAFRSQFPRQLTDFLLVDHLRGNHQTLWSLLWLLGLVRLESTEAQGEQTAHLKRVTRFEDSGAFLKDPLEYLRQSYAWGQSNFDGYRLFAGLEQLLDSLGFIVWPSSTEATTQGHLLNGVDPASTQMSALRMLILEDDSAPEFVTGASLVLLPETPADKPGFAVLPFGNFSFGSEVALSDVLTLQFRAGADATGGVGAIVRPNRDVALQAGLETNSLFSLTTDLGLTLKAQAQGEPVTLVGSAEGSGLQVRGITVEAGLKARSTGAAEVFVEFHTEGGKIAIRPGASADGFLAEILPASGIEIDASLGLGFSTIKGVYFVGSAGFEIQVPGKIEIGPVKVSSILLGARADGGGIGAYVAADIAADLSVVTVAVRAIGLKAELTFPENLDGNMGRANLALRFKPPTGAAISLDAGGVNGGGVLYFEPPRYFGAVQLSVFGIAVKAFGLIETELPDGSKGFSFVVVICAEFTPIQLGFGFTLIGVGGLVGIHRTVDAEALGTAARTGSIAHLLFPRDVVRDAPAIVHDLATVFPAAKGHYIFGPMAKLGWGTPTLITASIGVLLEFPGPRLGLIGIVGILLPSPEAAVVALQLAIVGLLDFPAKEMSVDAGLFDSSVASFPVHGGMAYRLGFGRKAKFLMSVGGFNPDFEAPAGFPTIDRVSVEFGVNGNPRLIASGYFALTSNTAQIGSRIDLSASGYGLSIHGWFGMDALFVFSPFSFKAGFTAGIQVGFHGAKLGVTLSGTLSGPTPWAVAGRVCVSVLFWDACLSVDHTFGKKQQSSLPEIDPWVGTRVLPETDANFVRGLSLAIQDPRSWSGSNPPAGFNVVSLVKASDETPRIDPLGAATLRQRVVPLRQVITRFGQYKPKDHDQFFLSQIQLGNITLSFTPSEPPAEAFSWVEDEFAPAQYVEMSEAERLSSDSYAPMKAGFTINPESSAVGSSGEVVVEYETAFIKPTGERVADATAYRPNAFLLQALLRQSGAAALGMGKQGTQTYVVPGKKKKLSVEPKRYAVLDACSSQVNRAIYDLGGTQVEAATALRFHLRRHPEDEGRYQVAPRFAAVA